MSTSYTVYINAANSEDGLYGTGFFGEDFSTKEELNALFRKYVPKKNVVTKLHFSLASTTKAIKDYGDAEAAKGNNINIFALSAIAKKDKYYGINIYFLPCGWIDDKGTFKFVLETANGEIHPQYNKKLSIILSELGIVLS